MIQGKIFTGEISSISLQHLVFTDHDIEVIGDHSKEELQEATMESLELFKSFQMHNGIQYNFDKL